MVGKTLPPQKQALAARFLFFKTIPGKKIYRARSSAIVENTQKGMRFQKCNKKKVDFFDFLLPGLLK